MNDGLTSRFKSSVRSNLPLYQPYDGEPDPELIDQEPTVRQNSSTGKDSKLIKQKTYSNILISPAIEEPEVTTVQKVDHKEFDAIKAMLQDDENESSDEYQLKDW